MIYIDISLHLSIIQFQACLKLKQYVNVSKYCVDVDRGTRRGGNVIMHEDEDGSGVEDDRNRFITSIAGVDDKYWWRTADLTIAPRVLTVQTLIDCSKLISFLSIPRRLRSLIVNFVSQHSPPIYYQGELIICVNSHLAAGNQFQILLVILKATPRNHTIWYRYQCQLRSVHQY